MNSRLLPRWKTWDSSARFGWVLAALTGLVVGLFVLDLALGSVAIPPEQVLKALLGEPTVNPAWQTIVREFRLPKALVAILAGASLASGGLVLQTLFANPLAGPFALGINGGAGLGVALVVLGTGGGGRWLADLGFAGRLGTVGAASLGAAAVLVGILALARRLPGTVALLVVGLMAGYLTSSVVGVLVAYSATEQIQAYLAWSNGSFAAIDPDSLGPFAITTLLGLAALIPLASPLNALLVGPEQAQALGIRPANLRRQLILATALLAGAVTAYCGPVAFLDIAVPQLCRGLLATADHRRLLPASILAGAAVALTADLLCQGLIGGVVLPLNSVTALFGAPVVVAVVIRTARRQPDR